MLLSKRYGAAKATFESAISGADFLVAVGGFRSVQPDGRSTTLEYTKNSVGFSFAQRELEAFCFDGKEPFLGVDWLIERWVGAPSPPPRVARP